MSDDLQQLDDWIAPLLERIEPAERRRLAREIGRDLRKTQRQRIKAQRNPDGRGFTPRKSLRDRAGSIRRKAMFSKLPTARYLKARGTPSEAAVTFTGRVARIARVHQYGLRDRVEPGGPRYHYPQRELLGFTRAERETIRDTLIDHLS